MECFLNPSRVRLDESREKAFLKEEMKLFRNEQQRPGELNQTCSLAPANLKPAAVTSMFKIEVSVCYKVP